jgi:hypothetical protein
VRPEAQGYDYEQAWEMALRKHPVRGVGWREIETTDLFEAAETGDGPVTFMRRATDDAWQGSRRSGTCG